MKKTFSTYILTGLTVLSLACYIFLSTAAADSAVNDLAQLPTSEMSEQEAEKVVLPDVTLVKKLINITKIVVNRD